MNDERYSIIYSSRTGNTRLLAEAIRESLPADLCDHFGTDEAGAVESEKLYVGFWTDKGTADEAALALLCGNEIPFYYALAGDSMETVFPLTALSVGQQARIVRIEARGELARRIRDMGLGSGMTVSVMGYCRG